MVAHRKDLVALSLAILLLASPCYPQSSSSNDPIQRESETWPLSGKVVNSVTGKPIPRVLVRLPELQRAALTDSAGNFSFANVPSGKVAITVSKPGYFHAGQPLLPGKFYVRNNSPYESQVGPQTANLVLQLLPEAVIVGTVRGDAGQPLAGVFVNALMPAQGKQQQGRLWTVREDVVTGADGKFFLGGLAPGRYYLRLHPLQGAPVILKVKTAATEERYPLEVYFPDNDAAGAAPLDLVAGQVREANFNLKLIRVDRENSQSADRREPEPDALPKSGPFQISGVLVEQLSGRPIPRGRVAICDAGHPCDPFAAVVTADDGRFSFSRLGEGKYILSGSRKGQGYSYYDSHDGFTTGIAVGPGMDTPNLVFRLPDYSSLSGRITDEAGEPVHKARVLLYWPGTRYGIQRVHSSFQAQTNEQGTYHFDALGPGKYFMAVMASPWYAQRPAASQHVQPAFYSFFSRDNPRSGTYLEDQGPSPLDVAYPLTFYPGTSEASAASLITLRSGEHFIADLALKPVPALHVFLSTSEAGDKEEAAKLESAEIQTRLWNGSPLDVPAETRILSSGQIDITGIIPGHYQVKVQTVQNNRVTVAEKGEMDVFSSGETILAHEKPSVHLTADVQFEGAPDLSLNPANESLFVSDFESPKLYTVSVPAPGTFAFQEPVEPGNYQLSMNSSSPHFIKALSASGATVIGNGIKIDGSSPVRVNVTVAFDGAIVTGVALRDGKPFAGAMILLAPLARVDPMLNRSLFKQDQSNSDGSFGMGAIAPGKYVLLAIENGWDLEWRNPGVLQPYLSHAVVLEVEEKGKYNVNVTVQ